MSADLKLPLSRGDHGHDVLVMQEWLSLHGYPTVRDSSFGPAMQATLVRFQHDTGVLLGELGVVGPDTWRMLTKPLQRAIRSNPDCDPSISTLGQAIVMYAQQHLIERPMELPINCGPWVRLYCNGLDGTDWKWCAGFAHYVVRQAWGHRTALMPEMPIEDRPALFPRCTALAAHAKKHGRLLTRDMLRGHDPTKQILPGDLGLVADAKVADKYDHVFVVTSAQPDHVATIEGNTSIDGSSNGDRVRARERSYDRLDFIMMPRESAQDAA